MGRISQQSHQELLLTEAGEEVVQAVANAIAKRRHICLLGPSGAGKTVIVAEAHRRVFEDRRTLIVRNCAAFSEQLLLSELFGHQRGAFSGAETTKKGVIELAGKGSLFLDEVGEVPLNSQGSLLTVVGKAREYWRVGGNRPLFAKCSFIFATNRNLRQDVNDGQFREDLYYRIAGDCVVLLPLRERSEEIEPLARLFAEQQGWSGDIPDKARAKILGHTWPGNIRELRTIVECAVDESGWHLDRLKRLLSVKRPGAKSRRKRAPRRPPVSKTVSAPVVFDDRGRAVQGHGAAKRARKISDPGRGRRFEALKRWAEAEGQVVVSAEDVADLFGFSLATAKRAVKAWSESGSLDILGQGRGTRYQIRGA